MPEKLFIIKSKCFSCGCAYIGSHRSQLRGFCGVECQSNFLKLKYDDKKKRIESQEGLSLCAHNQKYKQYFSSEKYCIKKKSKRDLREVITIETKK